MVAGGEGWWLYILECQGGVLYTGIAKDVDARFAAHVKGSGAMFTRLNRPVRILGRAALATRSEALRAEFALKKLDRAGKLRWCAGGAGTFFAGNPVMSRNRLLDALPREVISGFESNFERLSLKRGTILHHPGDTIRHLYFPLNCMVSITVTMHGGKTAEAGAVGNREVVGVNAFMGGSETNQTEYVVQIEGDAMKIEAQPLLDAFNSNKAVRDVFLKYTQAYIAQLSQNVGCNRLHNVEQRFARWLLEVYDRIQTMDLRLTQEFIGEMLGVHRPTVTEIAKKLEEQGLITVQRGLIRISRLEGLERLACECYTVVKEEYDRLLGAKGKLADRRGGARDL